MREPPKLFCLVLPLFVGEIDQPIDLFGFLVKPTCVTQPEYRKRSHFHTVRVKPRAAPLIEDMIKNSRTDKT